MDAWPELCVTLQFYIVQNSETALNSPVWTCHTVNKWPANMLLCLWSSLPCRWMQDYVSSWTNVWHLLRQPLLCRQMLMLNSPRSNPNPNPYTTCTLCQMITLAFTLCHQRYHWQEQLLPEQMSDHQWKWWLLSSWMYSDFDLWPFHECIPTLTFDPLSPKGKILWGVNK